eukprot:4490189-Ditylum_brightwellii.AAC.1
MVKAAADKYQKYRDLEIAYKKDFQLRKSCKGVTTCMHRSYTERSSVGNLTHPAPRPNGLTDALNNFIS